MRAGLAGIPELVATAVPRGRGASDLTSILIWVGLLIAAVIVLGAVVMLVRRRVMGDASAASPMLLMEELRSMANRGELSPDEYEAARAKLRDRMAAQNGLGKPLDSGARTPVRVPRPVTPPPGDPAPLVARPGFDLTGAPLPTPPRTGGSPGSGPQPRPPRLPPAGPKRPPEQGGMPPR